MVSSSRTGTEYCCLLHRIFNSEYRYDIQRMSLRHPVLRSQPNTIYIHIYRGKPCHQVHYFLIVHHRHSSFIRSLRYQK